MVPSARIRARRNDPVQNPRAFPQLNPGICGLSPSPFERPAHSRGCCARSQRQSPSPLKRGNRLWRYLKPTVHQLLQPKLCFSHKKSQFMELSSGYVNLRTLGRRVHLKHTAICMRPPRRIASPWPVSAGSIAELSIDSEWLHILPMPLEIAQ
jgi:hypothetical protein